MKRRNKFIVAIASVLMVVTLIGALSACGGNGKTKLMITGSTSVTPLMKELAAAYEETHTDVEILITGVGSSQGVADAISGACDIGMISRAVKSNEREQLDDIKLANDGIALIVNKSSTLTNVTSQQVYDLYASGTAIGDITIPINRTVGSGTRDAFNELIKNEAGNSLKELASLQGDVLDQTGAVIAAVAKADNKMGYISLGSLNDEVKALSLDGVDATVENILNGSYGLQRPFHLVWNKANGLSDIAKDFIEFCQSEEGKRIITEFGCIVG